MLYICELHNTREIEKLKRAEFIQWCTGILHYNAIDLLKYNSLHYTQYCHHEYVNLTSTLYTLYQGFGIEMSELEWFWNLALRGVNVYWMQVRVFLPGME